MSRLKVVRKFSKGLEQRNHERGAFDWPPQLRLNRRRAIGDLSRVRHLKQFEAYPDDDSFDRGPRTRCLRQHAAELAPWTADDEIVRPFQLDRESGHSLDRMRGRDTGAERHERHARRIRWR